MSLWWAVPKDISYISFPFKSGYKFICFIIKSKFFANSL